jgi:PhnB protein
MGSDKFSGLGPELNMGNNFSLSANTKDINEADRIFNALSKGGKVTMPMENTFWGSYFGSLTDKFGINWMVNCDLK